MTEHCGTLQPVNSYGKLLTKEALGRTDKLKTTSHKTNIIPFLKRMFMCKEKPIRIGRVCTEKIKNV